MPAGNTNASRARVAEILARSRAMTAARRPRPLEGIAPPPAWAQIADSGIPLDQIQDGPLRLANLEADARQSTAQTGLDRRLGQNVMPLGGLTAPFVDALVDPSRRDSLGRAGAGALDWLSDAGQAAMGYIGGGQAARDIGQVAQATPDALANLPGTLQREAPRAAQGAGNLISQGYDWVSNQADPEAFDGPNFIGGVGSLAVQYGPEIARSLTYGPWENEAELQGQIDLARARQARGLGGGSEIDPLADAANLETAWAGLNAAFAPGDLPMALRGVQTVAQGTAGAARGAVQGVRGAIDASPLARDLVRDAVIPANVGWWAGHGVGAAAGGAYGAATSDADTWPERLADAGVGAGVGYVAGAPIGSAIALAPRAPRIAGRIGEALREQFGGASRAERATSPIESIRDVPFQASEQAPELVARSPERVGEDVLSGVGTRAQRVSGPEGYIEYEVKPDGWHITNVSVNRDIGDGQGLYARLMESAQANGAEILMGRRHARGSAPLGDGLQPVRTPEERADWARQALLEVPEDVDGAGYPVYGFRGPRNAEFAVSINGDQNFGQVQLEDIARADQYEPYGLRAGERFSPQEAQRVIERAVAAISEDAATRARQAYRLYPASDSHRLIYQRLARNIIPPEGYEVRVAPGAGGHIDLVRTEAAPPPRPSQLQRVGDGELLPEAIRSMPLLGIGAGAALGGAAGNALLSDANASDGSEGGGFDPLGTGIGAIAGGVIGGRGLRGASHLPMDEASRMARAREMGFDVETPLYHGTDADFSAFRGETWVSTGTARPNRQAMRSGGAGANVMPLVGRGRVKHMPISVQQRNVRPRDIQNARDAGYDAIEMTNHDGDRSRLIFDPSNIRSRFAAFDPARSGESDLMAGVPLALAGVGGGTAAYDYLDNGEFDGLGETGVAAMAIGPLGRGRGARAVERAEARGPLTGVGITGPRNLARDNLAPVRGSQEEVIQRAHENSPPVTVEGRPPWLGYNLDGDTLIEEALSEYRLARDPYQAGYILPDGKMLDFSEIGGDGSRTLDHRDVAGLPSILDHAAEYGSGTDGMIAFMNATDAVRYDAANGLFETQWPPTRRQIEIAVRAARERRMPLTVEASRPNGNHIDMAHLDRPTVEDVDAWFRQVFKDNPPPPVPAPQTSFPYRSGQVRRGAESNPLSGVGGARAVEEGAEAGARRIGQEPIANINPHGVRGATEAGTEADLIARLPTNPEQWREAADLHPWFQGRGGPIPSRVQAVIMASARDETGRFIYATSDILNATGIKSENSLGATLSQARAEGIPVPSRITGGRGGATSTPGGEMTTRILEIAERAIRNNSPMTMTEIGRVVNLDATQVRALLATAAEPRYGRRTPDAVRRRAIAVVNASPGTRRKIDPLAGIAIGGGALLAADAVSGGAEAEEGDQVISPDMTGAHQLGVPRESRDLGDGRLEQTTYWRTRDGRTLRRVQIQDQRTTDFIGPATFFEARSPLIVEHDPSEIPIRPDERERIDALLHPPMSADEMLAASGRESGAGDSGGDAYLQGEHDGEARDRPRLPLIERLGLSVGAGLLGRRLGRGVVRDINGALAAGATDYIAGGDPLEAVGATLTSPAIGAGIERIGPDIAERLTNSGADLRLATDPAFRLRRDAFAQALSDEVPRVRRIMGENYHSDILREQEGMPPLSVGDSEALNEGFYRDLPSENVGSPREQFLSADPLDQLIWMEREAPQPDSRQIGFVSGREPNPNAGQPAGFYDPVTGRPLFGRSPRQPRPRAPVDERVAESGASGGLQGVRAPTLRRMADDLGISTEGVADADLRRTLKRELGRRFDSTRELTAFLKRYGVSGVALGVMGATASDPLANVGP
jgi:hypothetical protein